MGILDERDEQIRLIRDLGVTTSEGAAQYRQWVENKAVSGEEVAQSWVDSAYDEGFRRQYVACVKRLSGTYSLSIAQMRRSVGRAFAVPQYDVDGVRTGAFQLPFWMECTWEQIEQLIQAQQKLRDQIGFNIVAMQRALHLREQCPDAKSPAEACERLKINPDKYFAA